MWLLHKKMFEMIVVDDGVGVSVEVADPNQQVPFCEECLGVFTAKQIRLPKFSLANDIMAWSIARSVAWPERRRLAYVGLGSTLHSPNFLLSRWSEKRDNGSRIML